MNNENMRHIVPYLGLFKDTARFFKAGTDITILEIGIARGASTQAFLSGAQRRHEDPSWKKVRLVGIDIEPVFDNVKGPDKDDVWEFIHHDSATFDWVEPIDVLFIDGDHSYEGARADYEKYSPFVNPGGLIYMHDVLHPRYGVNKLWEEIEENNKAVLPFNNSGLGIIQL